MPNTNKFYQKEEISFPKEGILSIFNIEELKLLIQEHMHRSERSYLDFKLNDLSKIENLISAFANTKSGIIIFGIGDKGSLQNRWKGVPNSKEMYNSIIKKITDSLGQKLDFRVDIIKIDNKYFIFVFVPVVKEWISAKGRYFVREGDNAIYITNPNDKREKGPPHFGFYFLEILKDDLIRFKKLESDLNKGFFKKQYHRIKNDNTLTYEEYSKLTNITNFRGLKTNEKCFIAYKILYNTDLSPKEVCRLKVNQIVNDDGYVYISFENQKIPISKDLYFEIHNLIKITGRKDEHYLFGNKENRPLSISWLTKQLKEQLAWIDIKDNVSLNTFRLSFIVHSNKKNKEILVNESVIFSKNEINDIIDLEKYENIQKSRKWVLFYSIMYFTMEFPGIICKLKTKSLIKKDSNYYLKFSESDLVKIKERDYAHLEHFINIHKLKEEDYLFGSRKRNSNKPTSVSWANRVFKEHLQELGLNKEGATLQSLRKSRILHLWQDGYTIEEILNEIGDPDKHRHVYRQRRRKLLRDFNLL